MTTTNADDQGRRDQPDTAGHDTAGEAFPGESFYRAAAAGRWAVHAWTVSPDPNPDPYDVEYNVVLDGAGDTAGLAIITNTGPGPFCQAVAELLVAEHHELRRLREFADKVRTSELYRRVGELEAEHDAYRAALRELLEAAEGYEADDEDLAQAVRTARGVLGSRAYLDLPPATPAEEVERLHDRAAELERERRAMLSRLARGLEDRLVASPTGSREEAAYGKAMELLGGEVDRVETDAPGSTAAAGEAEAVQ